MAILKSEEGLGGFRAWQRLHHQHNPKIPARAIVMLVDVVCQPKVNQFEELGSALGRWEDRLRVLERDGKERLSPNMIIAVISSMCPPSLKDLIYQQNEHLSDYQGLLAKLRALVRKHIAMGGEATADLGQVEYEDQWGHEIDAVGARI